MQPFPLMFFNTHPLYQKHIHTVANHVDSHMHHPLHNDHNVANIHHCCKHIILHDQPRRLQDLEVIIHQSIPTYEDSRALDILND